MTRKYSEGMQLAMQAKADYRKARDDAQRRYYAALNEALPVGSAIQWTVGDWPQDGVVASEWRSTGYVMVTNTRTGKTYELATYHINGMAGP